MLSIGGEGGAPDRKEWRSINGPRVQRVVTNERMNTRTPELLIANTPNRAPQLRQEQHSTIYFFYLFKLFSTVFNQSINQSKFIQRRTYMQIGGVAC